MRKKYEEVVRQWWMKREGGEERPVCPRCGRKAAKNGTYWTKNGERRQRYRCTRCKINVSVECLMPTYRSRYGKGIIVLVMELVMIMGIPLKSVAMLLNIRIQTVLDWFSGGKVVTGSDRQRYDG